MPFGCLWGKFPSAVRAAYTLKGDKLNILALELPQSIGCIERSSSVCCQSIGFVNVLISDTTVDN